ncbi:MAG TPA: glycosyltransferase [Dermatophilaceae bacterium]|nr:glycosyltransferase [Dermatophilaceae bacterium]
MPTPADRPRIEATAGVVVLYYPQAAVRDVVGAALRHVSSVAVVDNTPGGSDPDLMPDDERVTLLDRGVNLGLGEAYNRAATWALERDAAWLLILDQDSILADDYLSRMGRAIGDFRVAGGGPVAVAGPLFVNPMAPAEQVPLPWVSVTDMVISSGSLVSLSAWTRIGGFDAGLFIDYVDIDFCLRAADEGFAVVRVGEVLMSHLMGNSAENLVLGRFVRRSSNYPPTRHYYLARNSVHALRAHARHHRSWARRELVKRAKFTLLSALVEPRRPAMVRATVDGLVDGLRGRRGPDAHPSRR